MWPEWEVQSGSQIVGLSRQTEVNGRSSLPQILITTADELIE
jgi:hypothetical protein